MIINIAYIPIKHLIRNDTKIYNWVNIAEKLIGTPYVWGEETQWD